MSSGFTGTRRGVSRRSERHGRRGPTLAFRFRALEVFLLLVASAVGVLLVSWTYGLDAEDLASAEARLAEGSARVLGELDSAELWEPHLTLLPTPAERRYAAATLAGAVRQRGDAATLRSILLTDVEPDEVRNNPELVAMNARLERLGEISRFRILSPGEREQLSGQLLVRNPQSFRESLWRYGAAALLAFLVFHVVLTVRKPTADPFVLPLILLLTAIGFCTMLVLVDPLRGPDRPIEFLKGVTLGALVGAMASLAPLRRIRWRTVGALCLALAVGIALLLALFGSGPGDARINLFGGQPIELIKILIVIFLASYFADRWELMRELDEGRFRFFRDVPWLKVPKLEYLVPPVVATLVVLAFLFAVKDLGPTLILGTLFTVFYCVARAGIVAGVVSAASLGLGVWILHRLESFQTVSSRLEMWFDPWDNFSPGGNHLAHSLWALASGGWTGLQGQSTPAIVPEAHTDFVLTAIGETAGFFGLVVVFVLYFLLFFRWFRTAYTAPTPFSVFLSLGLLTVLATQLILISGGVLGVLPLTGVVSPFLSYGKSSMLANFMMAGFFLSVSAEAPADLKLRGFAGGLRVYGVLTAAVLLCLIGRVAYVQGARAGDVAGRYCLTTEADQVRRPRYNPRLESIERSLSLGTIRDRNGIPLATSNGRELQPHRELLAELGVTPDSTGFRIRTLGGIGFSILGDADTRVRWNAPNTSFVERDEYSRLLGFDHGPRKVGVDQPDGSTLRMPVRDLSSLFPLLGQSPESEVYKRFQGPGRDVATTFDLRLQKSAADILRDGLKSSARSAGAIVVVDAASGDLLASVSYPWPDRTTIGDPELPEYFDRARYGIYPPGSTFKPVVAMAALGQSPDLFERSYRCSPLTGGRVGALVEGWGRPVRDHPHVTVPHNDIAMTLALSRSCNAYFAQLAAYDVKEEALLSMAGSFGIEVADPNTVSQLSDALAQAGFGQGQVVATPLQMAKVAATLANEGRLVEPHWRLRSGGDEVEVLEPEPSRRIAEAMLDVTRAGTGRKAFAGCLTPVGGKTGTAESADRRPHSWFIGFAPFDAPPKSRVAFAVLVEEGGDGSGIAASVARSLVDRCAELGMWRDDSGDRNGEAR